MHLPRWLLLVLFLLLALSGCKLFYEAPDVTNTSNATFQEDLWQVRNSNANFYLDSWLSVSKLHKTRSGITLRLYAAYIGGNRGSGGGAYEHDVLVNEWKGISHGKNIILYERADTKGVDPDTHKVDQDYTPFVLSDAVEQNPDYSGNTEVKVEGWIYNTLNPGETLSQTQLPKGPMVFIVSDLY